jgi:hypothetical protein
MKIRDYNGTGQWSVESVVDRYRLYTQQSGTVGELTSKKHTEGDVTWIYPIMDEVIAGIERGDKASIAIGIEFIEEDQNFSFGRVLKSNTARALRRAVLSQKQVERVRERVVRMLLSGFIRREFKEYAKLLRRIGVGSWWSTIEQQADRENPYVMRYYAYLRRYCNEPDRPPTAEGPS